MQTPHAAGADRFRHPQIQRAVRIEPQQRRVAETGRTQWTPVVDGVEIPDQPRYLYEAGAFAHVPVLLGTNRDEGWTFVNRTFPSSLTIDQYIGALETEFGPDAPQILTEYPSEAFASQKDALARVVGDLEYGCEARRIARLIERFRVPVFLYSFEHEVDPVAVDRVPHGLEVNFVFGNNFVPPLFPSYTLGSDDLALWRIMAGYWTRFAATGNPNTDDPTIVHWAGYTRPTGEGRGVDKYLLLEVPSRQAPRFNETKCNFWEQYFVRSTSGSVPAGTQ